MLANTTTGYHRDLQLLKEEIFPALATMKDCLAMSSFMLRSIQVKKEILQDPFFKHVFSVEVVNELVLKGVPFRDAYKQVGMDIESGAFSPEQTALKHTHEGSIGNLQLPAIQEKMNHAVKTFNFDAIDAAFSNLLK